MLLFFLFSSFWAFSSLANVSLLYMSGRISVINKEAESSLSKADIFSLLFSGVFGTFFAFLGLIILFFRLIIENSDWALLLWLFSSTIGRSIVVGKSSDLSTFSNGALSGLNTRFNCCLRTGTVDLVGTVTLASYRGW